VKSTAKINTNTNKTLTRQIYGGGGYFIYTFNNGLSPTFPKRLSFDNTTFSLQLVQTSMKIVHIEIKAILSISKELPS